MRVIEILMATKITRDTFHFYEKQGLFRAIPLVRSGNGYRNYAPVIVERFKLIMLAKDLGFSLKEISDMVVKWEQGAYSLSDKIELFQNKIDLIDQKIDDLENMKSYLVQKIENMQKTDSVTETA